MKKSLQFGLLLTGLLIITAFQNAVSSHLMGGNLGYEYLGVNANGLYQYRITITIYRYCEPGSSNLPTSMNLGVYRDNPAAPAGNKQLITTSTIPLLSITPITPPNGNDTCTFTPSVCVEEGVYQGIVSLASNTTGYYFIADRCCRNGNIANLANPGNTGQAYYAYAPPASTVNSSPTFAVAPVPFLCASDTVSILNQAYDPDGDLLVYNFVTPYQGISSNNQPNPNPPANYTWPIPNVNYAPGYSQTNPFGAGGYTSIDTLSGLASYYAPNIGFYVLAVEIREYRNGVLIGVSRRDLQIIVIACPINPAPFLTSGSQTNFIIKEGQTLCFSSTFSDSNGDSLFLTHTGDIFNPTIVNPPATWTDNIGLGSVTGNFCWTPSCDQGRSTPYQFSVSVTDNGCPAKVTNVVYSITVINTPAPASMTGPDSICYSPGTVFPFTVPNSLGNTFSWTTTNASLNGTPTGTTANTTFPNTGQAIISVSTVNQYGCHSDTLNKIVEVLPLPTAVAGPNVSFCTGSSANIGGPANPGYSSYQWTPTTGLSSATSSNPTVTLTNTGTTPTTVNYVLTVTESGCTDTDTVQVTVNPLPTVNAGPDKQVCENGTVNIGTTAITGQTYNWTPSTNLNNANIASPSVSAVGLTAPTTLQYILLGQNSFGCQRRDTVNVTINDTPVSNAGLDLNFCSGASGTLGTSATTGYNYSWSPATGLSSTTSSNPTVTLTNTTTSPVTQTYVVTTTLGTCTTTDTVQVTIRPNPGANAGPNQLLCSGSTVQIGTNSTTGYTYSWSPATGLNNTTISNPTVTLTNSGTTTSTATYIVTTNLNGCTATDTVVVTSAPQPTANAGPDVSICSGQSISIGTAGTTGYTYSWSPSTGLSSANTAVTNATGTNSGTTPVNNTYIVSVNAFGCTDADTVVVQVRPSPVSNAGANQLLCSGSTVQIGTTSTSGYTYTWSPATGLNNTTISNPTVTLTNNGNTATTATYVVTTTLNGCTSSDTVVVTSAPQPTANAGPDVSFCSGQSASIGTSGTTGFTYSWTPSSGLSAANTAVTNVTLTNNGTAPITNNYIVNVNAFGCTDADTVAVEVRPAPIADAGANQLLCSGSTVQIGTTSTAGYTYVWSPASGLNNTTISNPTVTLTNSGTTPVSVTYLVTVTLNGCTSVDSVTINSGPQPTANAGPDVFICSGQSISIGTAGTTGYTYSWSPSTGLSNANSAVTNVTATNTGTTPVNNSYIVSVNAFGCADADTVVVQVRPNPISNAGANQLLCAGSTVQLGTSSTTGYTYSWSPATGLNNTTISNPTLTLNNTGTTPTTATYIVTTTLNGCVTSDTVVVTSAPQPTANAGPDVFICSGQSISIGTAGTTGYTYSWTPSTGLSNTNSAVTNVTATNTGTTPVNNSYIVSVNAFGCADADTVVVQVRPNPISNAGANQLLCAGSTVQLGTSSTTGYTYSWSPATGLNNTTISNPTLTLNNTGTTPTTATYIVTTTLNGCVTSDTVVVTSAPQPTANAGPDVFICSGQSISIGTAGTTGYTYSWTPSTGLSNTNSAVTNVTATNTGTTPVNNSYIVNVNAFGCTDADTVVVQVRPNPVSQAGPNQLLCAGSTVQLGTSSTTGYTYSWSPATGLNNTTISNPTLTLNNTGTTPTTATYIVTTTLNGCVTSDTVVVTSAPQPTANAGPDVFICSGQSISIGTTGTTGYTYSWSPSTGLSNANSAVTNVTATNTGTTPVNNSYIVNVNAFGCTDADTVVVQVRPNPVSQAGPNQLLCAGSTVQLGTSSTTGYTYSWSPATGLNNTTISNPTLTLNNTGTTPTTATYIVTTTLNGCVTSDTVVVTSAPQPTANAGPDVFICSGQSISIGTAGTTGYTYSWTPSTGLSNANSAVTNVTATNTGTTPVNNSYIVSVNAFGCTDADTVVVQVRPNPVSQAGPNQLLCAGSTVQLGTSSTTGYTYSWSPATGLNNTTISNPTLTLNNTGTTPTTATYIVTTTLNGCVSSDTVVVTSAPQPTANAGPDVFICSGQSISIGTAGTTGYTYSWTPSTGLSNANSAVTNVTATNTGTTPVNNSYIVNVNAFGCTDADTVVVQVRPNPVSQAGPDVVLCGGDTLVLGTSSTTGYTYSWSPATNLSNTNISSPTLIVSNNGATPNSQTYVVTTTLNGCTTTDSATITINPQPIILANAAPTSICAGDTAQLVATGATTYAWSWQSNPSFIIGTNDTINVHPTATTNYVVTGSNSFGCSNTDTVKVTVFQIPIILATASNDTICSGDTLVLTGSGGANYIWNVLGGTVIGSTNPLSVTPNTNTTYVVTGTSSNGCSSTDTVSVIVNPGATANSILGNISVCPGVNGVLYWIPNANPNSVYTWSINGGTLVSGQGTDSILVDWASVSGIGTVSVIETTTTGCQSPDPVTLDVNINVILTPAAPAGPISLCANQAQGVVYNALNTPGSTYTWTALGGTIVSGQGTSTVTVNWTVTGPQTVYLFYDENSTTATNVCFGTSDSIAVTINPSPATSAVTGDVDVCIGESGPYAVTNTSGSSYAWNVNGGSLTSGNGTATINSTFPQAGNAVVSVVETNSYGCAGDTVLLTVIVHDLPAANAGPNVAFCSGQSVQLGASGGTNYQWSPSTGLNNTNISNPVASPSSTTNYIVQVTDQFGCVNADTMTVTVNPLPTITVTPASAICIGNSLPLNATGGNNYSWSPAGSLSNSSSSSPTASPTTSTVYTVVVTDQNGCVDSATVSVTVNPLPIATASNDTTVCTGSSVSLIAGGGVSYSWAPQTGLSNATVNNPVSTPTSPITYTVTVTDQNGCTDTEDVSLTLNDVPVASFEVDENVTTATCNGIETTLINTSQNATNYYWSFPDGSTSTDVNPTYNFGLSGTVITLVAQNNICYDTLNQNYSGPLLDVLFDDLVNVFTPNNDGKNDCFELGANFNFDGCSAIQIFNRWGRPVFTSGAGKYCWNGKTENTGDELPSGTYYLTVTVAGSSYKGTVTLIR